MHPSTVRHGRTPATRSTVGAVHGSAAATTLGKLLIWTGRAGATRTHARTESQPEPRAESKLALALALPTSCGAEPPRRLSVDLYILRCCRGGQGWRR
ncbi:hypothetical protein ZWY2020_014182 [Hordeum vulgare]|nr:hypothetical protein ZWY2020_014182 [Hordeum vulgare]